MKNSTKSSKVSKAAASPSNNATKAAASPSNNATKKSNLRSYKPQSPSPIKFTTITPEKQPQRIRNRGVALSISEITKVAKGLQQDQKQNNETTPSQPKSARRQISLWPSSPRKPKIADNDSSKFPEKYKILNELFHGLETLIWLSRGKRAQTFTMMKSGIEDLTGRTFKFGHLAQMKFVLPEAIVIKKIFVRDERTSCMVPDLQISLNSDGVADDAHSQGRRVLLKGLFEARVREFWESHPEVADIPEAVLPEPFSEKNCSLNCEDSHVEELTCQSAHVNSSTESLSISNQIEMLPGKYELYPAFRRHFSQKNIADDQAENVQCSSFTKPPPSSQTLDNQEIKALQKQCDCALLSDNVASLRTEGRHLFQPSVINTPVHLIRPLHSVTSNNSESKDMKNISSAADSFMTETPARSAPGRLPISDVKRRRLTISDVKPQNSSTQESTYCHKPAKRVLDFSLMDGNDDLDTGVDKLESNRSRHEFDNLPEPCRGCPVDCNSFDSVSALQEAEGSHGDSFEKIIQNQAGLETRHRNYSPLLDLVNVIHSIFQSVNRTPITKQELMHKILMNSLNFFDMREVEKQVESLEKLVPDWICKKSVLIGDMYCINKMSDLDSVRTRVSSINTV